MNKDQVKGKAKEVEGEAQRKWGEATDDTEHKVKGTAKEAAGEAQQAYGDAKEAAKD